MYVNCFPLHFCCLQLLTNAMLLYNSAICDLLRESIQIMKILIHLKVVILVSEKWNEHNLMYIDHKQCEIMQKIQWNSSKANCTDFPLTDGAVVEPQCLCKCLQTQKGNWEQYPVFVGVLPIFWQVWCLAADYMYVRQIFKKKLWATGYRALKQKSSTPQGFPPPTQL